MADEVDYTSDQMRRKVEELYSSSLTTNLQAWDAIQRGQDELEWSGQISPDERRIDAQAAYANDVLTITVNNVLPRKKNDSPASLLRLYWTGNIVKAIMRLDDDVSFEKAHCIIAVYGSRDVGWDVDNRAISYIVNALRASGVIPGDEWEHLSLTMLGGVDKKNPRTEIRVMEQHQDIVKILEDNR